MKTKLYTLLIALAASVGTLFAEDPIQIGVFNYTLDDTNLTAEVQQGPGHVTTGHVIIPPTITYNSVTYDVTSIKWGGFIGNEDIKSIIIPNSITVIGRYAFEGCHNLTSVTLSNSISTIDTQMFNECYKLNTIIIPSSVTTIRSGAFAKCTGLTSIMCEACVPPTMGTSPIVFYDVDCSTISLHVPCGSIAAYQAADVWKDFSSIEEGIASGTCGVQGDNLIWRLCDSTLVISGLGEMQNYQGSVTPWNDYSSYIKKIIIEEGVTTLTDEAFWWLNIDSVAFPTSLRSIGESCFEGCSNIKVITIPNGVKTIKWSAFQECSGLTSITIPSTITDIEEYAFSECYGLKHMHVGWEEPISILGDVFDDVALSDVSLHVPCGALTAYQTADVWKDFGTIIEDIPIASGYCGGEGDGTNLTWELSCDSVLTISGSGTMAYYDCTNTIPWNPFRAAIKEVIIENGVTSIGNYAFTYCANLASVTIPNSVVNIGWAAFGICNSLTSIEFPNSVTSIGNECCVNCQNLISIIIGSGVINIGNNAFEDCLSLTDVYIRSTVPPVINANVFADVDNFLVTLHVPCGSLAAYQAADIWKDFGTIVEDRFMIASGYCGGEGDGTNLTWELSCDSVLTISGNGAMANYTTSSAVPWSSYKSYIKEIVINKNVTSIGNRACYLCRNLTSVIIGDSVTSIGNFAFYKCSSLATVDISDYVTNIGSSAFAYCTSLTDVYARGTEPVLIDSTIFRGVPLDSANLHVPCGTVATYRATEVWKNFGNIIGDSCTYVITWKDYNGTILDKDTIPEGAMPIYKGETPQRPETDRYTYEFIGWRPDLQYAFCDTTYTAKYKSTSKKYKITFVNYDGAVLYTDTVNAGAKAKYKGDIPSRPSTEEWHYYFVGWTPELTTVLEDLTFTAIYDSLQCKTCTINYYNADNLLQTKQVNTCAPAQWGYDGPAPISCDTSSTYFIGWSTTQYNQKQPSFDLIAPAASLHSVITTKDWKDANQTWTSLEDGYDYFDDRKGLQIIGGHQASAISKQRFTNVAMVEVIYCTDVKTGEGTITISIDNKTLSNNTSGVGHTHRSLLYNFSNDLPSGQIRIDASATENSIFVCEIIVHSKNLQDISGDSVNNFYALFCKQEVIPSTISFSSSDFSETGTAQTGSELSSTKDSITLYLDKGYAGNPLRSYADGNIVFSSTAEPLQKIVIRTNTKKGNANNLTLVSGGTVYSIQRDSLYIIWEGYSNMVKFHTAAHVQFSEITVTGGAYRYTDFMTNCHIYNVDVSIPDTIDSHGTVTIDGEPTYGDTITLTANPEDGYYFDSWSDGNTDNPRDIVVTEDINVYPIFKKCEEVIFTFSEVITKGESFEFAGMSLSQKGTYSDTTVLANGCDSITILKLNVVKPKTFNLRVVVNDETMGTVEGAGTYTQGQQVTITATPVSNKYVFVRWYNEDEDINIYENPYTFELNRNLQIRAVFRRGKK